MRGVLTSTIKLWSFGSPRGLPSPIWGVWVSSSHTLKVGLRPIIFFPGLLTWGFYSHFVVVKYMKRGPIGRNVVCSSSLSCSSPYSNSPFYLCFPFLGGWYTYSTSYIICGFCIFRIVKSVISIRSFSVANEMCSLVSLGVKPFYIISS